jgi:2-succinyl-6-hydroxy-2,4-cyclohexadiene-1-carboxylate synthase
MSECSTLVRGSPSAPPLIFLHGFLGCKEDWEEMLSFFDARYYCIAIDLPGHAGTPYSEDIVSTIQARILPLGSEKPILIGYSMGGRIALQLRQWAKALVVISGHPGLKTEKEKEQRWRVDQMWSEKILHAPFETFLAEWYAQALFHPLPKNHLSAKSQITHNPQHLASALLQMSLAKQSHIDDFPCQTLFVHGEIDLKYRDLYSNLPKTVSVRQVLKCGHIVHKNNAAECAQQILNWLNHADT